MSLDDSFKDIDARTLEIERETAALEGMTAQERAAYAAERDAKRWSVERDKEALQARLDKAHDLAVEFLKAGDVRRFILETFKTQHIGDNETAEGILIGIANQSISNSKGIQPAVYGESGQGKSHAARAMLHLFPARYYMNAALSDKALFYLEADELRAGMTIFSDDAKISDGIESVIKRATTQFQEPTINKVPTKEGGKWKTKDLKIPPRINWLLTSVDSQGSEQLINRQIGFGVDESGVQDVNVTAFELEKAAEGRDEFSETDEVLICREIINLIKEDNEGKERLFKVKIPFAERIAWLDMRNRRNLPIFLDMIKGYATLNFMQRERDETGALIATINDFKAAERLYNTRGGFQKLHIHEREKEMLQFIAANNGELTTDELMHKMELSGVRVRQIAARLETVLPRFKVELRSESKRDASDEGKTTITRVNYYCYDGAVNLDLFGSVVSLHDDDEENDDGALTTLRPLKEHFNSHFNMGAFPLEEAQSGALTENKEYNNNNKYNNNLNKEPLKGYLKEDTHARACSSDACLSGRNQKITKTIDSADLLTDAAEAPDSKTLSDVKVGLSGLSGHDQATLAKQVKELLEAWQSAHKAPVGRPSLISAVVMQLLLKNPGFNTDDGEGPEYLKSFIERISTEDKEIQGLLVTLTR